MFSSPCALFDKEFILSMGPQRCGTSWIDRYLRKRGDVCLPSDVKEIFFFDRNFGRGTNFYRKHFRLQPEHQFVMEVSTTSFDCDEAPARVFEMFGPDVRLLCPLRHPVMRSYSLYLHCKRYGMVRGSLREACRVYPQIISSSRYAYHLQNWLRYFSLDQIEFVFQEDLERDQEGFLRNLCAALDLDFMPVTGEILAKYNATTFSRFAPLAGWVQNHADWLRSRNLYALVNIGKAMGLKDLIFGKEKHDAGAPDISDEDRLWLEGLLLPEIRAFEALIGRDVPQWKEALYSAEQAA